MRYTFLVLCSILSFSCSKNLEYKHFIYEDSFEVKVNAYKKYKNITILNYEYALYSTCPLVTENRPDWLRESYQKDLKRPDSLYIPTIGKVSPPYKMWKEERSLDLFVAKNGDTLVFKLIEFGEGSGFYKSLGF